MGGSKYGHKGEITLWQDLHNIIIACYESLLRLAVEEYNNSDKEKESTSVGSGWRTCALKVTIKFVDFGLKCCCIYMLTLFFMECSWLPNYVECKIASEYVHLNKLVETSQLHSELKKSYFHLQV